MMASSSLPSSSKPKPPQHIRFSTEIAREMRPDTDSYTFSAADISATSSSDDSDVKSSLLPQPVGYKPRRRSYAPGVSTKLGENRGNIGLVVALLMLGMLFGTIIWENEGSESAFLSGTSTTAVSLVKRVLVGVDVFVMDQTSTLQHGAIKMGQFFHVLSEPYNDDPDVVATGRNGVVSSDVDVCSQIGVDVMKKGGNAVDAAIATAACIGSINMFASGVGGGGFMVVRMANGVSKSFNFREAAPANATRDMYSVDAKLAQVGGLAVAVPGEVHGFSAAHRMFGSLPWKDVWAPSIKLNTEGFKVTQTLQRIMLKEEKYFYENPQDWPFLFSESGSLLVAGQTMKRPAYAQTLAKIAAGTDYAGVHDFYNGTIGCQLAKVVQAAGGILTDSDFSQYHSVVTDTVNTTFMGNEVITCPQPCSGPVLLEGLNIAELLPMRSSQNAISFHYLVEVMKWLSAGRTELGDPYDAIVAGNSLRISELGSKDYAEAVRANISADTTYSYEHYNPAYEPNDPHGTSHLSVIDKDGNAVGLTTTVNLYWGARLHDPVTGVVLNSEMDDFSIPGRSNAYRLQPSVYNYIQPFKRPLSSTSPTIVVDSNGEACMVIGGSGGSRIVTGVFEAIIKKLVWGYSGLDTIRSPRLHHQLLPENVSAEGGVPDSIVKELESKGHVVDRRKMGEAAGGSVLAGVWRNAESGTVEGVADWWRKGGKAKGY